MELDEFETIVRVDEAVLATPNILKYDDAHLFVFDAGQRKVLELDTTGNIIFEYSQEGRGPGEIQWVDNIFLTDNSLFLVDPGQFLIHKFNRTGKFNSSFDYGAMEYTPLVPGPPISFTIVHAQAIENKPHVTTTGDVLLSPVSTSMPVQSIYHRRDWGGNRLTDIGEIPDGSTFQLNNEKIKSDVEERVVPSFYRPNAFPVNAHANSGEIFLIYNALPKIAKYNESGEKLWETGVPDVPEIDSLTTSFYKTMERMQRADSRNRIGLQYYHAGTSSETGELFLISEYNGIWIHQFDPDGVLTRRYKLLSEEVKLHPIFDIDFDARRIFVVTEEAEIRAYDMKI